MRLVAASLLLLAGACAGPDRARTVEPAPEVEGYRGVVAVALPGVHAPLATYPALLRRTTDPARGQIVDETIVDRGGRLERVAVIWDVAATPCAVTERGGRFSGTCEMEGAPWKWHARRAVLQRPVEGIRWIEEREVVTTPDGFLVATAQRAPDGTPGLSTTETYVAVPAAEFEALWLRATR